MKTIAALYLTTCLLITDIAATRLPAAENAITLLSPANDTFLEYQDTTLTWSPVEGATRYEVQVSTNGKSFRPLLKKQFTKTANLSINRLALGKTYYWRVRAYAGKRRIASSPAGWFSTLAKQPVALAPEDGLILENTRPTFQWQDDYALAGYQLQLSLTRNFRRLVKTYNSPNTHYTPGRDLKAGVQYWWRVRGKGVAGYGAWSEPCTFVTPPVDPRGFIHGVNLLSIDGHTLLIFSGNRYPPTLPGKNWGHDVFYSWIDSATPGISLQNLVHNREAQEPASAAVNANGKILVTCEDGNGGIDQHAGLWDSSLNPITPYPQITIRKGGHSGHTAALGDQFLVVYGEGWINDDGVNGLGTGDDVWARIVKDDGSLEEEISIAVNSDLNERDWWPEVAASDANWLGLWQHYQIGNPDGGGSLQGALIQPDGTFYKRFQVIENLRYYYYAAVYLPNLERYAVVGSQMEGGFISLIDKEGNITQTKTGLPQTVREARPVFYEDGSNATLVYPTTLSGAAVIHLTADTIELVKNIETGHQWGSMGTDGIILSSNQALFANGTAAGIRFVNLEW
jgi:hypothetical protein